MEDVIKQLKELGELLKSGAISQEEFQVLKKELIKSNKVDELQLNNQNTISQDSVDKTIDEKNKEKINFSLLKKGCFLSMASFVLIIGLGYWFLSTPWSDNSDILSDENIINDSENIANKKDAEKFVIGEWQANSSYAKYKWRFKFNSNYIVTVDTKSKDQNVWSDWERPNEMYWEIRVLENDDGSDGYWIYMSRKEDFTNGKISNVGLQIHIDADWIGNDLLYGGLRKEGVAWKVN